MFWTIFHVLRTVQVEMEAGSLNMSGSLVVPFGRHSDAHVLDQEPSWVVKLMMMMMMVMKLMIWYYLNISFEYEINSRYLINIIYFEITWITRIFRRVRKIAKSDYWLCHICPSVLLPVRLEQLDFHWRNTLENLCLRIFPKSFDRIQVSLKSDKNNGYFVWRPIHIYETSLIFLRMRNISDNSCKESHNTHFTYSNFFV